MRQQLLSVLRISFLFLGSLVGLVRAQQLDVIQFSRSSYSVAENAGQAVLKIQRTGPMTDYLALHVQTEMRPGSADLNDFEPFEDILEVEPGQSNVMIRIQIINDSYAEGWESFDVVLSDLDPFCCQFGANSRATVTIEDNDLGVQFGSAYYSAAEDSGQLQIDVSRFGDMTNEACSIALQFEEQTATHGTDFLLSTNRVGFLPGQTNATISILLLNDAIIEAPEYVLLKFAPCPSCCSLGYNRSTLVRIDDNDLGVEFSSSSFFVAEEGPQPAIRLQRAGEVIEEACFVTIGASGTATKDVDYSLGETAFVFLPGETHIDLPVFIFNDALREDTESFSLYIVDEPFNCVPGSRSSTAIYIADNDRGVFVEPSYTVAENQQAVTIQVWRTGDATNAFTVDLVLAGSAVAGTDFVLPTNRLHFAAGQTNLTLLLPLLDDPLVEGEEYIDLSLTNVIGDVPLGFPSTCRIFLQDNEYPANMPGFWFPSSYLFTVEDWTNAYVTVVRGGNSSSTLSVDFTTAGNATPASDFGPASGTLIFQPLETVKYIALDVFDNCRLETNKSIEIILTNASPGAAILNPARATLWIVDDDGPGSLGALNPALDWLTFPDVNSASYGPRTAVASQPDGKIIIGRNGVMARLNNDGSQDPAFAHGATICGGGNPGRGFVGGFLSCGVNTILLEPPDYILAGGMGSAIRVNNAGIRDSNFLVGAVSYGFHGSVFPGSINQLLLQPDGKIVAFGTWHTINGGSGSPVRLNADSSIDQTFGVTQFYGATCGAILSDGKLLAAAGGLLARLHPDGHRDEELPLVNADGEIRVLVVRPDAKVLLGGQFSHVNAEYHRALARLNTDGSLDPNFNPVIVLDDAGPIVAVQALTLSEGSTMVVAGSFSDGTTRVLKLDSEGSLIGSFNHGPRFSGPIDSIIEQPGNGELLVAGSFDSVNGIPRPGIARLKSERSHLQMGPPQLRPDGSLRIVAGSQAGSTYVLRSSTDLAAWTDLATNLATDCTIIFEDANPGSVRFYRIAKLER